MELGEAAYTRDNGTPGCLARRFLSDAAPSPLLLLPAVSPPVAVLVTDELFAAYSFARIGRGRSFIAIGGSRTVGDATPRD